MSSLGYSQWDRSKLKSLKIITQNKPLKLLNFTCLISVNGYKSACFQDKTISVSMSTCDFQVQSGPVVKWLAPLPPNSRKFLFQTCPRPFSVESACSTCAYKHFLKVLHFRQSKYILVKLNHDSKWIVSYCLVVDWWRTQGVPLPLTWLQLDVLQPSCNTE